jgi:hypothetical protein
MVTGDGNRGNLTDVHPDEQISHNAFLSLNKRHFEGLREETRAGEDERKKREGDESIEVSYTLIEIGKQDHNNNNNNFFTPFASDEDDNSVLQEVAAAINVQLTMTEDESGDKSHRRTIIPFIPFNGFDSSIRQKDKLFLYGPSGCGKSRSIFEIIKDKLTSEGIENIYIINPRNKVGKESGRQSLVEIANKLTDKDAVLWDNFPDDLIKRNISIAIKALEIISSRNVKMLIVTLKPQYLEVYDRRNIATKVPELYAYEIAYDKERIKNILKSYGTNIIKFKHLYQNEILKQIDKVSEILWQKEPIPLTVLAYYEELKRNHSERYKKDVVEPIESSTVHAAVVARKLLRRSDYYEHQFELIASNSEERQRDMDFLYTLKLAYESELNRTVNFIEQLQRGIFHTDPPFEPSRKLSAWVYLSWPYYAIHDAPREAIKLTDYVKAKIMTYIADNFLSIVPSESNQIYSFAMFLGRNFQFIPRDKLHQFLPENIFNYMKNNVVFTRGLAQGLGESFPSIGGDLREEVLRRTDTDGEFAKNLGDTLGYVFSKLDELDQEMIFETIAKSPFFARGLGFGLGSNFAYLSKELQKEIFERIKANNLFARGLGEGLGAVFVSLSHELQEEAFKRTRIDIEFSHGLGFGLGYIFKHIPKEFQTELFARSEKDAQFAKGLGFGLGYIFPYLPKEFQTELFARSERSAEFSYGLGFASGYAFEYLPKELKEKVFARSEKDAQFAKGLGYGLGYVFNHLSKEFQMDIFTIIESNAHFSYGLASGLGHIFTYLPKESQEEVLERAEAKNNNDKNNKNNNQFSKGLEEGLSQIFEYLDNKLQKRILELADGNLDITTGFHERGTKHKAGAN